jgi:hypothetical protein
LKIEHPNENERPEPGSTVLDLLAEYGTQAVLEALALVAECASEDQESCSEFHKEALYLNLEFSQLLERYAVFAEAQIPALTAAYFQGAIVV